MPAKPLALEDISNRISDRGIIIATPFTNPPKTADTISFRCSKGHLWKAILNNVLRGSGCPQCKGVQPLAQRPEVVITALKARGITLISSVGSLNRKHTFQCAEGHQWQSVLRDVYHHKSGCPHCRHLRQKK